jgi:hypothetical protein
MPRQKSETRLLYNLYHNTTPFAFETAKFPSKKLRDTACLEDDSGVLGREPINLERPADVRFGADNGLKSDMAPCPKSAKLGSRGIASAFAV